MKYTKEQVKAIYDETERRLYQMVFDDSFEDEFDRREYQKAMLQGVYSALMATAANWPDVAQWCQEIEHAYPNSRWAAVKSPGVKKADMANKR